MAPDSKASSAASDSLFTRTSSDTERAYHVAHRRCAIKPTNAASFPWSSIPSDVYRFEVAYGDGVPRHIIIYADELVLYGGAQYDFGSHEIVIRCRKLTIEPTPGSSPASAAYRDPVKFDLAGRPPREASQPVSQRDGSGGTRGSDSAFPVQYEMVEDAFILSLWSNVFHPERGGFPATSGTDGSDGSDGVDGGNGGALTVVAREVRSVAGTVVEVDVRGGKGSAGGRGGDGGDGGNGGSFDFGDGKKSSHLFNEPHASQLTRCLVGAAGGKAGKGGQGGLGGQGGRVSVKIGGADAKVTESVRKLFRVEYRAGQRAADGEDGRPGNGGRKSDMPWEFWCFFSPRNAWANRDVYVSRCPRGVEHMPARQTLTVRRSQHELSRQR